MHEMIYNINYVIFQELLTSFSFIFGLKNNMNAWAYERFVKASRLHY
jgi:hypothetical protein